MKVAVGTYAGTGSSQTINPSGWSGLTPSLVMVKGGNNVAVIATSSMSADNTKPMVGATALFSGGITSLLSGGFSVGTDARVNANGTTYFYLAVYDNGAGDFKCFSYSGDGTDNRDITVSGLVGTPSLVITMPATAIQSAVRTDGHSGDNANLFDAAQSNDRIQSFSSGSFQVGTKTSANQNGTTYHAIAVANTASLFQTIGYTGNGTDNRNITGVGFQPDFTLILDKTNGINGRVRFKDEVGDLSFSLAASSSVANLIQSFQSDGFQIGTDGSVNANGDAYVSFSFKVGESAVPNIGTTQGNFSLSGDGLHIAVASGAAQGTFSLNGGPNTLQTGTGTASLSLAGLGNGGLQGPSSGATSGHFSATSSPESEIVYVPEVIPGSGGVIPITGNRPTDIIGVVIDGQGRRFGFDPLITGMKWTTVSPGGDGQCSWSVNWPGDLDSIFTPVGARVELHDINGRFWVGIMEEMGVEFGPNMKTVRFTALGYMATCSDQSFLGETKFEQGMSVEATMILARDRLCPFISGSNSQITPTGRVFTTDGLKDYRGQSAVKLWNDMAYMGNAGDEKLLWHIVTPPDGTFPPVLEIKPRSIVPLYYVDVQATGEVPFVWKRSAVMNRVSVVWQEPASGTNNSRALVATVQNGNSQAAYPLGIGAVRDHYVSMTGAIQSETEALYLARTYLNVFSVLRPEGNTIKVQYPNQVKLADNTVVPLWRVRAGNVIQINSIDTGDPLMSTEPLLIVETEWDEESHVLSITTEKHQTLFAIIANRIANQPTMEVEKPKDGTNGENGIDPPPATNGQDGTPGISGSPGSDANPNGQSNTLNYIFGDGVGADLVTGAFMTLRVDYDCTVVGIYASLTGGSATVSIAAGEASQEISLPFFSDPLGVYGHLGAGAAPTVTITATNACKRVHVAIHVRRGFLNATPE